MAADAVSERMTDMRLESDERVPYTGNERLVIAIDLGTTYSKYHSSDFAIQSFDFRASGPLVTMRYWL